MEEHKNSIIRSNVAEYLTFITASGESGVEAVYADENVALTKNDGITIWRLNPNDQ